VRAAEQRDLFLNEAEALATGCEPAQETETEQSVEVGAHERKKRGRKPLDPMLPREVVRHELPELERVCARDGNALVEIGAEISEQLDIVPQQVRVIQHQRIKYACPCCDLGIKVTSAPARIIPKGLLTESALAWVVVSKFADALPLYRIAALLHGFGGDLSRGTRSGVFVLSVHFLAVYTKNHIQINELKIRQVAKACEAAEPWYKRFSYAATARFCTDRTNIPITPHSFSTLRGIDGGYIRLAGHSSRRDGWFEVIVGKSLCDGGRGQAAHAQSRSSAYFCRFSSWNSTSSITSPISMRWPARSRTSCSCVCCARIACSRICLRRSRVFHQTKPPITIPAPRTTANITSETANPTTSRAAPITTASTFASKPGAPGRMVTPLCLSLFCCLSNCIASPIAVFPGPYQREAQQRNQYLEVRG